MAGWTVHAIALHRRLAAAKKDELTGLLRRHGDDVCVLLVDQDRLKDVMGILATRLRTPHCGATADRHTPWAGPARRSAGWAMTSSPSCCLSPATADQSAFRVNREEYHRMSKPSAK
ncbi:hypothetical protein [Streptomyces sp. DASNCL29]|uniref:hypothetical protein n=1 Tax=Streptomyces sp. DASNCL29 TaxID=2583819 RepID=UPI00110F85D2|nr:hypothetical protein [Streptomyces sp. DASNCL29]TMU96609.1 hypothetical protein FGK60_00930 [Streptomyces sp. DASNCL29]